MSKIVKFSSAVRRLKNWTINFVLMIDNYSVFFKLCCVEQLKCTFLTFGSDFFKAQSCHASCSCCVRSCALLSFNVWEKLRNKKKEGTGIFQLLVCSVRAWENRCKNGSSSRGCQNDSRASVGLLLSVFGNHMTHAFYTCIFRGTMNAISRQESYSLNI